MVRAIRRCGFRTVGALIDNMMQALTASTALPARERSTTAVARVVLFLLLLTTFFYRGALFGPVTGSSLIAVAAVALAALLVVPLAWERGSITIAPPAAAAFALAVVVNVLANGILHPAQAQVIVRFGLEIALNLLLYYVALVYLREQEQPVAGMCKTLILAAVPMVGAIMMLASALATIRRIGGSEQIGTAVNHLAHALVVTVVAAHFVAASRAEQRSTRILAGLMLLFSVLGVILTGSRASLAALLVFAAGVAGVWARRRRLPFGTLAGAAAVSLLILLVGFGERLLPLVRRFSLEVIRDAALLRLDVMMTAFNDVRVLHLLLGAPWRYEPLAPLDPVIYPHNLGLSMLLHVGVLPFVLFTYLILTRLWRLARAALSGARWQEALALGSILMVTVLYASTSGRLTRVLTIFFALGAADGWLYRRRGGGAGMPPKPERHSGLRDEPQT